MNDNYGEILEIKLWNFPKVERNDIMLNKTKHVVWLEQGEKLNHWRSTKTGAAEFLFFNLGTVSCSLSSFAVVFGFQLGPVLL